MTGIAPRKGFLPLDNVLEVIAGYDISVCINWARSTIEGQNPALALAHTQQAKRAGKLGALMFSGTTLAGNTANGRTYTRRLPHSAHKA